MRRYPLNKLKIYYMLDKGFKLSEIPVNPEIKKSILKAADHFKSSHECAVQKVNIAELDDSFEMLVTKLCQVKNIDSILQLKDPKNESSFWIEYLKSFINKSSYSPELLAVRFNFKLCPFLIPPSKQPKYLSAINYLSNYLKDLLQDDGVLFFPSVPYLAPYKQQMRGIFNSIEYPMIVNVLGFPSTNVTMGLIENGIPVGFQVIAAPNQDRLCWAVAEELERAFGGWVLPPTSS